MRLDIADGYTLEAETDSTVTNKVTGELLASGLPVVKFKYRPALPEALAELRYLYNRAGSGKEQLTVRTTFIVGHLVSWDVVNKGEPVEPNLKTVRMVPDPILTQIENIISTWAPEAEAARGN